MKNVANKWLFLVILIIIMQISANFSDYKLTFDDPQYLTESILQIIDTDLDNDQQDEITLAGANYIARELFIYWLSADEQMHPEVKWKSPNLYEDHSIIWAASGKFISVQNQLLVFSSTRYYLFQFGNNNVNLLKENKQSLDPLCLSAGDIDGDGQTEIILAREGKITSKIINGIIQVWKFNEGNLELVAESDLLGNIRGVGVGDIDQDGCSEIFIDEGYKFGSGNIHMFRFLERKLNEKLVVKKAANGPIYAMQVKKFSEGVRLVTSTAKGNINFFAWENNTLVKKDPELNFNKNLMSMATPDLNHDQIPELVVACYPQEFMILKK